MSSCLFGAGAFIGADWSGLVQVIAVRQTEGLRQQRNEENWGGECKGTSRVTSRREQRYGAAK